jgi:16S rRNA (uracil1498-N3)-methyltransferase
MPGNFTFYCNSIQGEVAFFDETEAKHALQVLRYDVGDEISFTDGMGNLYEGLIARGNKQGFETSITKKTSIEKPIGLDVCVSILKSGDRMEWAVEKCTELGVSSMVFFQSQNGERGKINLARMQKVAVSAMKQSHGAWMPEILQYSWKEVLEANKMGDRYIAYCGEREKFSVSSISLPGTILIGPEGDFSKAEIEEAIQAGWKPLDLGTQILRTETAVVAISAALRLR